MTLEELNEMSVDELEKLSDQQLLEFFAPHLTATRPDLAALQKANVKIQRPKKSSDEGESSDDLVSRIMVQFNIPLNL